MPRPPRLRSERLLLWGLTSESATRVCHSRIFMAWHRATESPVLTVSLLSRQLTFPRVILLGLATTSTPRPTSPQFHLGGLTRPASSVFASPSPVWILTMAGPTLP